MPQHGAPATAQTLAGMLGGPASASSAPLRYDPPCSNCAPSPLPPGTFPDGPHPALMGPALVASRIWCASREGQLFRHFRHIRLEAACGGSVSSIRSGIPGDRGSASSTRLALPETLAPLPFLLLSPTTQASRQRLREGGCWGALWCTHDFPQTYSVWCVTTCGSGCASVPT